MNGIGKVKICKIFKQWEFISILCKQMVLSLSTQRSVRISMAHIGTGNGVDERVGRADTHDQMSYIKNNAKG
jgi:hypothetical protein